MLLSLYPTIEYPQGEKMKNGFPLARSFERNLLQQPPPDQDWLKSHDSWNDRHFLSSAWHEGIPPSSAGAIRLQPSITSTALVIEYSFRVNHGEQLGSAAWLLFACLFVFHLMWSRNEAWSLLSLWFRTSFISSLNLPTSCWTDYN